jgi:hypothetical protein
MTDEVAASLPESDPVFPAPQSEPESATDRLRAFEDEHFGAKGDKIERGSGSAYAAAPAEIRRQHAAIEHLIVTEQKLADAHAAVIQAEADHEAALAAAEPKPDAAALE